MEDDLTDDEIRDQILLDRIATPRDQANAALFLVSEEGSFVNGTELKVTGGKQ
jgi:NAD(P)-dependent dehydrogenase (short-subunit alcohol dehydrogenase family)